MPVVIRRVVPEDMAAITAIYAHAVRFGTASFETLPPDTTEMIQRCEALQASGYPYLVAEDEGKILGYAYAGPFRTRAAYRPTVEDSIYVDPDAQGKGIGALLLEDLIDICIRQGFHQMIAVIGDVASVASQALHARCGFHHVGILQRTGYKHGRWIDTVLMQRELAKAS